jgi:hypothetical protein
VSDVATQILTAVEPALEALVTRVRGEYREMPGLRLTTTQFCRLFGVSPETGRDLIDMLLEAHFLRLTSDGTYGRFESPP